jgi:DNA-binding response OmpR family regulator
MNRKILLVDDDPAVRRMLLRVLDEENYDVRPARTGREALEFAASETFHLVLLDINLPGENGWEICETFLNSYSQVPIIVITARSNQLFPAMASGVGALMEKPLDMDKLLWTIRGLLEQQPDNRVARMLGSTPEFHYVPGKPRNGS